MLWICLLVLSIGSSSVHGEESNPIDKFGIQFRLLEPGRWDPLPLYRNAREDWNVLLGEFPVYTLTFSQPMRAVVEEVQAREGEVRCDCGLFVQIAAQLLSDSTKGAVLLPTIENFPEAVACACGSDLAYLRIQDSSAHQNLQATSLMNKGQWLLALGEDRYLGLDGHGVHATGVDEWIARIRGALVCEMELSHVSDVERSYVQWLLDKGMITNWSLDHYSSTWPQKHREDLERILNQVQSTPISK